MRLPKGLLIFGFGGHARAVADVALACGIENLMFFDLNARDGENFAGHPVRRDLPELIDRDWACMPASGDNLLRSAQISDIGTRGWPVVTLVAPSASLGFGAIVSKGSFVGRHAHLGPMSRVGEGCIVNTGAIVEHESCIGDHTHVSVNATICGRARVGDRVFIGAGATVIDGICVCSDVVIGAGGVAVENIDRPGVYVGAPARRLDV